LWRLLRPPHPATRSFWCMAITHRGFFLRFVLLPYAHFYLMPFLAPPVFCPSCKFTFFPSFSQANPLPVGVFTAPCASFPIQSPAPADFSLIPVAPGESFSGNLIMTLIFPSPWPLLCLFQLCVIALSGVFFSVIRFCSFNFLFRIFPVMFQFRRGFSPCSF